ncbi:transposase [Bacillus sp. DX1.1]|uniref:RNA-guided endonuclease InsQ/TnpB family protein n=1 Tax=unclassified Bacillus (in: firmicutes) TaxID=185979 RepID=UPI002570C2B0|nr:MULTISPECIES: transposase [unclassified Bacillus (in: firmicutes)]MDM5155132.1 transposase [Bacillus sp. DX1.1]WJE79460.1 transposase [Bacillus sp. DX3.1]
MFVTHAFQIPFEKELYEELRNMQRETATVWNDIVREATSYYFTWKKWLSKSEIQAVRKQTYNLHSQTVQAIADKYEANRETIRKLRKTDKKVKYPWRRKYYYCIPLKKASMEITDIIIKIKRVNYEVNLVDLLTKKKKKNWNESIAKKNNAVSIPNLAMDDVKDCNYAEIVWRNGAYWFCYSVAVPEKDISEYEKKVAGGDLGEIHTVTVATKDKALLVSGRAIRSISQFRAKALADLSKKMSRCKKGSRQWKKYKTARNRIRQKSKNQIEQLEHKTTKEVVQFLEQEQVTHFVIGNVSGIEKNTKQNVKKKQKNNKKRRQQLSLWNQGKIKQKLTYKAKLKGIKVEKTEEIYTSQDCPFCGGRHKANGRRFICSVHKTEIHRDVNGAQNIARKLHEMDVQPIVSVVYKQPVWYKRFLKKSIACRMA